MTTPSVLRGLTVALVLLSAVRAPNATAIVVDTAELRHQITGVAGNNSTQAYDVLATDLGVIWQHGFGSPPLYLVAFGDTYGQGWTAPGAGDPSEHWRCNVMALSKDNFLADGFSFSAPEPGMIMTPPFGPAKEILPCAKTPGVQWTVLPTAGVSVGTYAYLHYMSLPDNPAGNINWKTKYSGIAYSWNSGQDWSMPSNLRWDNTDGKSTFQMAAFVHADDGFVYMFGTPSGRLGSVYVARVPEGSMLTKGAYQYYSWIHGGWWWDDREATPVVGGPVGELSVVYNTDYQKWIMLYLNESYRGDPSHEAIVMRESNSPTGGWSAEQLVVDDEHAPVVADRFPGMYGSFMHPVSADADDLYFLMSLWTPYQAFLMHADIGSGTYISPPDVGQCGAQGTPYGNCTNCGCAGPNVSKSWSSAHFQVRYKCCFVPDWGQWQDVGTNTSYTAPYSVFDYEVQVLALTADGTSVQWYPWTSGNKNGSTKKITWSAAKYGAQLTHADWFMNACNDGTGANLPNCVDSRAYSTSTAATFSGLSPGAMYSLYVDLKDNQNTGTSRPFHQEKNIGPSGLCVNCAQPPSPTPTATPTAVPVISSDCSAPVILRPTSDGGLNNWDFPSGSHWDDVDEVTSDGDATYISSTVDGRWDQFNHASVSLIAGATISRLRVYAQARYATASTNNVVGPALRLGGNYYWADRTITGTYSTVFGEWTTNPTTGQAWTVADVNAALISVRKSYTGADVRVTQVWAQIDCSPPPPTSCAAPIVLRPTGNGSLNNWDVLFPNSGAHWQKVSEVTADEDATYLSSTVDARWDDFTHTPLNISPSATIDSVTVYARSKWTSSSSNNIVAPALRSAGTQFWADRAITNAYGNVFGAWSTDPATGLPWTQASVNAAYVGVRKSYQGADVRVTQVWVEVRCTGP